jgi:hypothetical protein
MSRGVPEPKLTAMDAMIDKLTGAIFLFQLTVVVVLGAAGNVWKDMEARKVVLLVNFLIVSYILAPLLLVYWGHAKIFARCKFLSQTTTEMIEFILYCASLFRGFKFCHFEIRR